MYKKIQSIKNLKSKKVLLKLDLNLSFSRNALPTLPTGQAGGRHGKIDSENAFRIEATLKTIKYLINKGAKVIIISYIGRPDGKFDKKYKMDSVAKVLSKYLNKKVKKLDSALPEKIKKDIEQMKNKDIIILENIRFYKEEMTNDMVFAKNLAKLFDLYINDSFSNAHRKHMSSCAITKFLPSYIGFRFEYEISSLKKISNSKLNKAVLIIGGAKAETKLPVISKLQNKFDVVLLGGVLANNFLYSRGCNIGKSIFEKKLINESKKIDSKKIILPIDVVVSKKIDNNAKSQIKYINDISNDDIILDIGPETIRLFSKYIKNSKFILWNGPLGYFEIKKYRNATEIIIKQIKKSKAISYSGGGETVVLLSELKKKNVFNFISTGGGAMLEFLSGKEMPGLKFLINNKKSN